MSWWNAVIDAGAVLGTGDSGLGIGDPGENLTNDTSVVEESELQVHPIPKSPVPNPVSFLNGIQHWTVVAYDGLIQIVAADVAAAVRRRDARGVLRTVGELRRSFAIAPLERLRPHVRETLQQAIADIETVADDLVEQPARYLEMIESTVRRVRAHLERELAEEAVRDLGDDEWLVLDGLLSRSPAVARHPRALGVIKSHGAQFLQGRGLERALTLPAGHRTSVFAVRGGHTRTEVYSWYLRLWPWEGNDLLYGLLRVEARADAETVRRASELSGWLWAERAPLATPAARWDRLLYPLHDVEEYLNARAPRAPSASRARLRSRLPVGGANDR